MIQEYFRQITSALASSAWVKSAHLIRYDISEIGENEVLVYRFRIDMFDGGLLEISERIVHSKKAGKSETTRYSFHWQNAKKEIIKRWDNAPHHPEIETYPHHIHIGGEDNVMPCFYIPATEVIHLINKEFSFKMRDRSD